MNTESACIKPPISNEENHEAKEAENSQLSSGMETLLSIPQDQTCKTEQISSENGNNFENNTTSLSSTIHPLESTPQEENESINNQDKVSTNSTDNECDNGPVLLNQDTPTAETMCEISTNNFKSDRRTESSHTAHTDMVQEDISLSQKYVTQDDLAQRESTQEDKDIEEIEQKDTTQKDIVQGKIALEDITQSKTIQKDTAEKDIVHKDTAQSNITAQENMTHEDIAWKQTTQSETAKSETTQEDKGQGDKTQKETVQKDSVQTESNISTCVKQECIVSIQSIKTERRDLSNQVLSYTQNTVMEHTQPSHQLVKQEIVTPAEVTKAVQTSYEQPGSGVKKSILVSNPTASRGKSLITLTKQPRLCTSTSTIGTSTVSNTTSYEQPGSGVTKSVLVSNPTALRGKSLTLTKQPHLRTATSTIGTSTVSNTTTSVPKILMLKSPLTYVNTTAPGSLTGKKIVILKNKQFVTMSGKTQLLLKPAKTYPNTAVNDSAQRAGINSAVGVKTIPQMKVYPTKFSDLVTVVKNGPTHSNMYIKPKRKKVNKEPLIYTMENGEMVQNKSTEPTKKKMVTNSTGTRPHTRMKAIKYELRKRDKNVMEKMREDCKSDSVEEQEDSKSDSMEEQEDKDYKPKSGGKIPGPGTKRKSVSSAEDIIAEKSVKISASADDNVNEGKSAGQGNCEVKEMEGSDKRAKGKDCNTESLTENTNASSSSNTSIQKDSTQMSVKQSSKKSSSESSSGESAKHTKDDSELTTDELEKEVEKLRKLVYPDGKGEDDEIGLSMQVETEEEFRRNQNVQRLNAHRQIYRIKGRMVSKRQYFKVMKFKEMNERKRKEREKEKEKEKMEEKEQETAGENSEKEKELNPVYCFKCVCYHPEGICTPRAGTRKEQVTNKKIEKVPLTVIKNKKLGSCKNSVIKALATMPDELSLSYVDDAHGFGIFTTEDFTKGTQLGPVEGEQRRFCEMSKEQDLTNIWVVQHDAFKEENPDDKNYICMDDEMNSNWCRYIRATTMEPKSNLRCVVEESTNHIYLQTTRKIEAGEELLYFIRGHEIDEDVATENERHCPLCRMTFDSTILYAKHILIFHTFGRFKYKSSCKICQKIFYTSKTFERHCREEHGGAGGFKCKECGKEFLFEKLLQNHWQNVHVSPNSAESAKLPCETCGKIFPSRNRLTHHVRNTHGGYDFKCETCGKAFKTSGSFSRHQNVHNPEAKVTCEFCGKTFRDSGNLKVHLLTHSKQKPFQCKESGCDAAYTTKQQLQFHYKKTHNYMADNMPEITRSLPYTMEAYAMRAAETEVDASKESDSEENSSDRSPRDEESSDDPHAEGWSPSEHVIKRKHADGEEECQKQKVKTKSQCTSKSKSGGHNTRSKRNSDPNKSSKPVTHQQFDKDRPRTSSYKKRDQHSPRERESTNMNSNIHHQMSPQTNHLWGHAPSQGQGLPYGAPYMEDLRHMPLRYPQPYNTMDIHHNHMHDVHPSNFSNPNEFDSRVMQLMEL